MNDLMLPLSSCVHVTPQRRAEPGPLCSSDLVNGLYCTAGSLWIQWRGNQKSSEGWEEWREETASK